ncbi:hypothetical protein KY284_020202 [Solanum tuberosum]|nr:hypothetical protein KY284_020202 [Solanum tuberosum]
MITQSQSDLHNKVVNMLLMYGSRTSSFKFLYHMRDQDVNLWHLMINGYALNGLGVNGLDLYVQMRELHLNPHKEIFLEDLGFGPFMKLHSYLSSSGRAIYLFLCVGTRAIFKNLTKQSLHIH